MSSTESQPKQGRGSGSPAETMQCTLPSKPYTSRGCNQNCILKQKSKVAQLDTVWCWFQGPFSSCICERHNKLACTWSSIISMYLVQPHHSKSPVLSLAVAVVTDPCLAHVWECTLSFPAFEGEVRMGWKLGMGWMWRRPLFQVFPISPTCPCN